MNGTALTMESNRIAKESLEAGQRAYIAPSSPFTEINVIGKEEPRIDVAIPWHNDGPTPAVDAIHYFWAGELPSGLSDKHFFPGCPSVGPCMPEMAGRPSPDAFTSTFIGGKADVISRRVFWRYSFLFDTSLLATHHLDKNLFAIGWVAYRDVFPDTEPHLTQTCNSVSSYGLERLSNGQRRVNIKWATDGCGRHNCIDRQCSTYDAIVAMLPPRK